MGLRLNLKWSGLSVQSPLSTSTSSSWTSSYFCKGRDSSYLLQRLSAASVIYGETETLHDTSRAHVSPSSPEENYCMGSKDVKIAHGKRSQDGSSHSLLGEDKLSYLTSLQATEASKYSLLLKNLDVLENMFADSNGVTLERDILNQLERLGALSLFHSCLSRTLKNSNISSSFHSSTDHQLLGETYLKLGNRVMEDRARKVAVSSGKKELRRSRRQRVLLKNSGTLKPEMPLNLKTAAFEDHQQPKFSSTIRPSRSRTNRRRKIARNEADMASGVKAVAEFEKIRKILEQETGQIASLSAWAEAAGIKKTEFQRQLHYGLICRDELLRSTRSLILFIARNYWGLGVSFEDLIQAGNIGVLEGAERFDQSRGYKFSTYVQYWIRKSMSVLVAKHARGIRIPCTLSKVINQVQKARKALKTSHGKYPDDCEIAKFTGLSLSKISSASRCLKVVGSIDQKVGESINAKFLEIIPDTSLTSPEEAVIRKHAVKDVYALLNGLKAKEKEVIMLRYGLGGNCRCKSLDEIGQHLQVSKEWIRRMERSALAKLRRDEDSFKLLSHYLYYMQ